MKRLRRHPELWAVAIGFAAFAVGGLLVSLWDGVFNPEKVGTLGEWAAAVGTVGAVLAALWAVRAEQDAHRDEEQRAMAAGVVSHVSVRNLEAGGSECRLWINVFSSDPLRHPDIRVEWSGGAAMPMPSRRPSSDPRKRRDELERVRALTHQVSIDDHEPNVGLFQFSHIDPGERGWERQFHCTEFDVTARVLIRWFDRWDAEWYVVPGHAPARVPSKEARRLADFVSPWSHKRSQTPDN